MDPFTPSSNSREMRVARIAIIDALERAGGNMSARHVSALAAEACNRVAKSEARPCPVCRERGSLNRTERAVLGCLSLLLVIALTAPLWVRWVS